MTAYNHRAWRHIAVALLGLAVHLPAQAWWNDEWAFRKELTFNTTPAGADIADNQPDVPVLVRLSLANFTYFADAKPDGSDLRFIAADDKTPLKFHIEKFDAQAQIALVWLRMPQVTGGSDTTDKVYLYYGNPQATDASDAAGSYDGQQSLVYHFATPAGTPQDSTGYGNEPAAHDAEYTPASLIGGGLRFAGGQQLRVNSAATLALDPAKGMTVSAWVRFEAQQARAQIAGLEGSDGALSLGIDGLRAFARLRSDGQDIVVSQPEDLAAGNWHHIALRASNGRLALYVNGRLAGESAVALAPLQGALNVGLAADGEGAFAGDLDELQVAAVARPEGWILAAARSQGMDAPLLVYGADAQQEGAEEPDYFSATLRNLTFDGWVVIVILMVMFVASTLIMIFKAMYLTRVGKGNRAFLAEFHKLRDDPMALERSMGRNATGDDSPFEARSGRAAAADDGPFGASTLWRLYHHGVHEALGRLNAQRQQGLTPKLSGASIEAIRATLDASATRMNQQLSAQMVWLTISIAGGPFLGLLGTVVGVMITFAAIAVAGDVNVNAIAPGTAAALVATVAGLAVAIPCLFGYNFLNTRAKEISTDMRVFVDELVTRLAETYS